jgi:ribosome-associated protein
MLKKNSKIIPRKISSAENFAKTLARLIYDKKGEEIIIFDLKELSPITDYFVIANGLSIIHIRTIAEYLMENHRPDHVEGLDIGSWVLLDFFDVIIHLFLKDTREFYGLERLWGDAARVQFKDD